MRVRYYAAEWTIFRLLNDSIGPESGRAGHNGGKAQGARAPRRTDGGPPIKPFIYFRCCDPNTDNHFPVRPNLTACGQLSVLCSLSVRLSVNS